MNHGTVHKTNSGKEFRKEMEEQQVQRRVRRRLNHCELLKRNRQEFYEGITNPEIADPLIERLIYELYNFGIQPINDIRYIEIWMEYAMYWTQDEENTLTSLWYLLGKPMIFIMIDRDRISKFFPYVYEGFQKTLKLKILYASICEVYISYPRRLPIYIP